MAGSVGEGGKGGEHVIGGGPCSACGGVHGEPRVAWESVLRGKRGPCPLNRALKVWSTDLRGYKMICPCVYADKQISGLLVEVLRGLEQDDPEWLLLRVREGRAVFFD